MGKANKEPVRKEGRIHLRIPVHFLEKLQDRSRDLGMSMSEYVRHLIAKTLENERRP